MQSIGAQNRAFFCCGIMSFACACHGVVLGSGGLVGTGQIAPVVPFVVEVFAPGAGNGRGAGVVVAKATSPLTRRTATL
jgi:hypothetical protein